MMSSFFVPSVLALCAVTTAAAAHDRLVARAPRSAHRARAFGPQKKVGSRHPNPPRLRRPCVLVTLPEVGHTGAAAPAARRSATSTGSSTRPGSSVSASLPSSAMPCTAMFVPRRHRVALAEGERLELPPVLHRHPALAPAARAAPCPAPAPPPPPTNRRAPRPAPRAARRSPPATAAAPPPAPPVPARAADSDRSSPPSDCAAPRPARAPRRSAPPFSPSVPAFAKRSRPLAEPRKHRLRHRRLPAHILAQSPHHLLRIRLQRNHSWRLRDRNRIRLGRRNHNRLNHRARLSHDRCDRGGISDRRPGNQRRTRSPPQHRHPSDQNNDEKTQKRRTRHDEDWSGKRTMLMIITTRHLLARIMTEMLGQVDTKIR